MQSPYFMLDNSVNICFYKMFYVLFPSLVLSLLNERSFVSKI